MKKERKPKISYEPQADVISWEISEDPIDHAKEIGDVVVHFSRDNEPVYLEILEASKFVDRAHKIVRPALARK